MNKADNRNSEWMIQVSLECIVFTSFRMVLYITIKANQMQLHIAMIVFYLKKLLYFKLVFNRLSLLLLLHGPCLQSLQQLEDSTKTPLLAQIAD